MWEVLMAAFAILWPPLIMLLALKIFPDLFGKTIFKAVEHVSDTRLARLRDELSRDTSVHVETLKADLQASYSTLKTSVDFLSVGQAGLRAEIIGAVRIMWNATISMRRHFGTVIYINTVYLPDEIDGALKGIRNASMLDAVSDYRNQRGADSNIAKGMPEDIEQGRVFVGDRLWIIFFATRALYGRLGYLMHRGFEERKYIDWRDDSAINHHLSSVLPIDLLQAAKREGNYSIQKIFAHLEAEFLHEATRLMSGSRAFADSLSDLQATLLLHTRDATRQSGPDSR